jgi:DNA-directed RNA polymerase specialized sigma24 family protein
MQKIIQEEQSFRVDSPDFKGYKITVLKPQSRQSEKFVKDKFRDEVPCLFESPDKSLVEKGGQYEEPVGDGNKDIENMGDNKDVEQTENRVIVRSALCKLDKIEHHIATMTMQGYSYREIQKELKVSSKTIRKALDKISSIIQ